MHSSTFRDSRLKMKLKLRELADRMGLSLNMIQKIEASDCEVKKTNELSLRWIAKEEFNMTLPYDDQKELRL